MVNSDTTTGHQEAGRSQKTGEMDLNSRQCHHDMKMDATLAISRSTEHKKDDDDDDDDDDFVTSRPISSDNHISLEGNEPIEPSNKGFASTSESDDDVTIVGADGLRLFQTEMGMDLVGAASNSKEKLPWMKICLPVAINSCETLTLYLDIDEPQVEAELLRNHFLSAYRARAHYQTLEELVKDLVASHAAIGYILIATSGNTSLRAAIMGTGFAKGIDWIDWFHCNIIHRHQARMLSGSLNLRHSLPDLQLVLSAACQILCTSVDQQVADHAVHRPANTSDGEVELMSLVRKGTDADTGAGTVHLRWTGRVRDSKDPTIDIHAALDRPDMIIVVLDF
ncbi:hypothetical protein EK21DRAFT_118863 [Setomelanomma holmii]|uniref:Uncharacterized protein n=1 Tax=Setomelanomma holmii TaxID=210430 RepID=A0A9P4LFM8_9PLEO|nr:hypothetical protein EK21DRAFT_118863 [Setomelanomma holmii]